MATAGPSAPPPMASPSVVKKPPTLAPVLPEDKPIPIVYKPGYWVEQVSKGASDYEIIDAQQYFPFGWASLQTNCNIKEHGLIAIVQSLNAQWRIKADFSELKKVWDVIKETIEKQSKQTPPATDHLENDLTGDPNNNTMTIYQLAATLWLWGNLKHGLNFQLCILDKDQNNETMYYVPAPYPDTPAPTPRTYVYILEQSSQPKESNRYAKQPGCTPHGPISHFQGLRAQSFIEYVDNRELLTQVNPPEEQIKTDTDDLQPTSSARRTHLNERRARRALATTTRRGGRWDARTGRAMGRAMRTARNARPGGGAGA